MARAPALPAPDFRHALLETYAVNDRMNQLILEHLHPRAWRAKPPGRKARTIAAIFAHVHNIRRKWLRLSAPHLQLPEQLDRTRCTQQQARAALAESALRCSQIPKPWTAQRPASRYACWPISSVSRSRTRPPTKSGPGKNSGNNADSLVRANYNRGRLPTHLILSRPIALAHQ